MKKILSLFLSVLIFASVSPAQQTAEVTITLNETFFDALLEAVFTNLQNPSFPLATTIEDGAIHQAETAYLPVKSNFPISSFTNRTFDLNNLNSKKCDESIRLMREFDQVKTSVKFRDGKITAPIAFSGSYNPPLIGCIDFRGWADASIELEFDANSQTLIGRAKVNDVRLSGTGGIGSSLIARLVQGSIDRKINPIQIIQMDKVSFVVPVQNSGTLKMKAIGIRHEVVNGALNVHVNYQFLKG